MTHFEELGYICSIIGYFPDLMLGSETLVLVIAVLMLGSWGLAMAEQDERHRFEIEDLKICLQDEMGEHRWSVEERNKTIAEVEQMVDSQGQQIGEYQSEIEDKTGCKTSRRRTKDGRKNGKRLQENWRISSSLKHSRARKTKSRLVNLFL